jgi:hypothetical protein
LTLVNKPTNIELSHISEARDAAFEAIKRLLKKQRASRARDARNRFDYA